MSAFLVRLKRLAVLATVSLWGCASMPVEPLERPPEGAATELLVYRVPAFAAGAVTAAVGTAGAAFAHLESGEYLIARMAPGDRDVFVRARSATATTVRLTLRPGGRTCVRVAPDVADLAKAMTSNTLMSTGYAFLADVVHCPTPTGLNGYKAVPVRYAESALPR